VHFGNVFAVEALGLTDGVIEFVEISDEKFGNRRDKMPATSAQSR
jgi:hypothetical protein